MARSTDLLDKARGLARNVGDKAKEAVRSNSDRIESAVDKTAGFVDKRTRGRFSKHVSKVQDAAHGAVSRLAEQPTDRGRDEPRQRRTR